MGANQGKSIKKTLKDIPDVSPFKYNKWIIFSPLNNIDPNFEKLEDLLKTNIEKETKKYKDNQEKLGGLVINLQTSNDNYDQSRLKKTVLKYEDFENLFRYDELQYLKSAFLTYSSDEVLFWYNNR